MNDILTAWKWNGSVSEPVPYGEGHINQTYAITVTSGQGAKRYILQKINVAAIGAVPLTPYGTPSTTEVPDAIEPYLNDHDVMLLENHGALTVGSDVITAYYRMESLELWAKITINAIILGGSYDIDRKNIDKLINLRSYYKITGKHPGYRKFERREKGEPTDK